MMSRASGRNAHGPWPDAHSHLSSSAVGAWGMRVIRTLTIQPWQMVKIKIQRLKDRPNMGAARMVSMSIG